MIACISKTSFKEVNEVQKNLRLGDILRDNIKFFESKEKALEEDYVPISFLTTVRTAYSNMVVEKSVEKGKRYYTSLLLNSVVVHRGYDLLMYMTSVGVSKCIDISKPENNELLMNSQFVPVGVYNPDVGAFNPMIYCQVVFNDNSVETLQNALLDGFSLVSIKDMQRQGNLSVVLSEIFEVKEEK